MELTPYGEALRTIDSLEEELELSRSLYRDLEKAYDEIVDGAGILYETLHSMLPHLAERVLDENPALKEVLL